MLLLLGLLALSPSAVHAAKFPLQCPSVEGGWEDVSLAMLQACTLPYDGSGAAGGRGKAGEPIPREDVEFAAPSTTISAHEIANLLYLGRLPKKDVQHNLLLALWGLFIYHDVVEMKSDFQEPLFIPCAGGIVDEACPADGNRTIPYYRPLAEVDVASGTRQVLNFRTSFLDLDSLYGRTAAEALILREEAGGRMLLTQQGLPMRTSSGSWMVADGRTGQHLGLLALHTLLLREHNRFAAKLADEFPTWGDEDLYQGARLWTVARAQHITITSEYLQILLGEVLPRGGYDDSIDPAVDAFSALALRHVWSMISSSFAVIDPVTSQPMAGSPFLVRDTASVAAQEMLLSQAGLYAVLLGAIGTPADSSDATFSPDAIRFSILEPVYDIQAARDMGIPSYNVLRISLGLEPRASFSEISSDPSVVSSLSSIYSSVDEVEGFVGAMAEDAYRSSILGETLWSGIWRLHKKFSFANPWYHNHENPLTNVQFTTVSRLIAESAAYWENNVNLIVPETAFFNTAGGQLVRTGQVVLVEGVYSVFWELNSAADSITITLEFEGLEDAGFFGFGFGATMPDADIIFAYFTAVDGSSCTVEDRHATGYSLPILDEVQDIDALSCERVDGKATAKFTRTLSANDEIKDKSITLGAEQPCIWSYNSQAFDRQHTNKGAVNIDFQTGQATAISDAEGFFVFHGIVMLTAFGVILPLAFFAARYFKHRANWLEIHSSLAAFAVDTTIPIAVAAIATAKGFKLGTSAHGIIGVTMLFLVFLQAVTGHLRAAGIQGRLVKYMGTNYDTPHIVIKHIHKWLGKGVILLGFGQLFVGLKQISSQDTSLSVEGIDDNGGDEISFNFNVFPTIREYILPIWMCLVSAAFIYLEVQHHFKRHRRNQDVEEKLNLPILDTEGLNERLIGGELLIIVGDKVVDIADFLKVHPGGSKVREEDRNSILSSGQTTLTSVSAQVLKESIGQDCTQELLGKKPVGQGQYMDRAHKHSNTAWTVIDSRVVAYMSSADAATRSNLRNRASVSRSSLVYESFTLHLKKKVTRSAQTTGSADMYAFVFTAENNEAVIPLQAGTYHKFRVVHKGKIIQRSYTPIAALDLPGGRRGFAYYISVHHDGQMGRALLAMKPEKASKIAILGPFSITEIARLPSARPLILWASGTGITPMLQVIQCQCTALAQQRLRDDGIEAAASIPSMSILRNYTQIEWVPEGMLHVASQIHVVWQVHSQDHLAALRQDLYNFAAALEGRMTLSLYYSDSPPCAEMPTSGFTQWRTVANAVVLLRRGRQSDPLNGDSDSLDSRQSHKKLRSSFSQPVEVSGPLRESTSRLSSGPSLLAGDIHSTSNTTVFGNNRGRQGNVLRGEGDVQREVEIFHRDGDLRTEPMHIVSGSPGFANGLHDALKLLSISESSMIFLD